jgi:hypothetical protein
MKVLSAYQIRSQARAVERLSQGSASESHGISALLAQARRACETSQDVRRASRETLGQLAACRRLLIDRA